MSAVFSAPYRWTTITILSGTVISSMDTYIVNTSMPRVLQDLGEPQFYAWVASAFILAQIVGLAIAGAWKDRAGLRLPFLIALVGFGVGSLFCALSPSMHVLVFSRAFQGLAGGALSALCFAAAAAYPERVRLRMLAIISGVWGILALGAPLLGGFITDSVGWRWIFLVNVPVCAAVFALGWFALHDSSAVGRTACAAAHPRLAAGHRRRRPDRRAVRAEGDRHRPADRRRHRRRGVLQARTQGGGRRHPDGHVAWPRTSRLVLARDHVLHGRLYRRGRVPAAVPGPGARRVDDARRAWC